MLKIGSLFKKKYSTLKKQKLAATQKITASVGD